MKKINIKNDIVENQIRGLVANHSRAMSSPCISEKIRNELWMIRWFIYDHVVCYIDNIRNVYEKTTY